MNKHQDVNEQPELVNQHNHTKLATLAVEFDSVLQQFPKLRAEMDTFLTSEKVLDYIGLVQRVEPQLEQAAAFLIELDFLYADLREEAELTLFINKAFSSMTLRTVANVNEKFHSLCKDIRQQHTLKQKALNRKAQARAKAERKQQAEKHAAVTIAPKSLADPEMCLIPAGTFIRGCVIGRDDIDGGDFSNEYPAHEISIASISMSKYPITFDQFDVFCEATHFTKPSDYGWGRGNHPVVDVSWNDAQLYIHWLNETTGKHYRLPSEAEWEYAARAGGDSAYPWGSSININHANYGGNIAQTTPVGQYPANDFQLYDMHGNVWEWCQDTWHDTYAVAPLSEVTWSGSPYRVLRGGSWFDAGRYIRSAYRYWFAPADRGHCVGFRVALSDKDIL